MQSSFFHKQGKTPTRAALSLSMLLAMMTAPFAVQAQTVPSSGLQAPSIPTSSVQLYGLVGTYIDSLKRSDSKASTVQEGSGGLTTSYFGIRGSEDIGGGTKVIFVLESFFQPNTGAQGRSAADPFFSRNSYVGVTGDFGTLTAGRQTNPTYTNMQLVNPFGSSVVFSPLVVQSFTATYGSAILGDTVWNNSVEYATQNYHGLTGTVIYGVSSVTGHQGADNLGLHLTYQSGPATAVFSAQRDRVSPILPETAQYAYLAGGAYDFHIVKVYGAAEMTSNRGLETGTHTYELGLSIPVGPAGSILAEWARTKLSAPHDGDTTRNTSSIAYDYRLSKRTDVYAVYSLDKLTKDSTGSTFGGGIRHTF
jgi:predicted porin